MSKVKSNKIKERESAIHSWGFGVVLCLVIIIIILSFMVCISPGWDSEVIVMSVNESFQNPICYTEEHIEKINISCGSILIFSPDIDIMCEEDITLLMWNSFEGLYGSYYETLTKVIGICDAEEYGNHLGICLIKMEEEVCE